MRNTSYACDVHIYKPSLRERPVASATKRREPQWDRWDKRANAQIKTQAAPPQTSTDNAWASETQGYATNISLQCKRTQGNATLADADANRPIAVV